MFRRSAIPRRAEFPLKHGPEAIDLRHRPGVLPSPTRLCAPRVDAPQSVAASCATTVRRDGLAESSARSPVTGIDLLSRHHGRPSGTAPALTRTHRSRRIFNLSSSWVVAPQPSLSSLVGEGDGRGDANPHSRIGDPLAREGRRVHVGDRPFTCCAQRACRLVANPCSSWRRTAVHEAMAGAGHRV